MPRPGRDDEHESAKIRLWVLTVLFLAVVLIASCSSNGAAKSASTTTTAPVDAPTNAATSSSTASRATTASAARVDAAALSISDFPTGWSTDAALATGAASGFCGKPNPMSTIKPDDQARVAFARNPQVGPLVEDWVIAYSDVASARQVFDVTIHDAASCTTFQVNGQTATVAQVAFAHEGDQSAAFRIGTGTQDLDIVAVRSGTTLVQIDALGLDAAHLQYWVAKALTKERAALG
jgi:hypothetical protein